MSFDKADASTHSLEPIQAYSDGTVVEAEEIEEAEGRRPREKRPNRLWTGLILIALLGGLGWFVFTRLIGPMLQGGPPAPGPAKVGVTTPIASTVRDSSEYIATLQSRQSVSVQPQVSGRITQIYVKSGDRVTAGTPLLQLDASEQQAQVAGNISGIQAAGADLTASRADAESAQQARQALEAERASRQSDLDFNEKDYERYQNLARQGAISKQLLAQKLNALSQARASLAQVNSQIAAQSAAMARAQANISRSQQQRDQAVATANQSQVQLRYYTVKAPIEGTIGDIPAKVGDLVSPTSQMLNVTQNRQLEIQIAVPLEKAGQLRTGLPVQLLSQTGQVLQRGAVSYIAPSVDPQNQSIQVKAVFSNDGQLRTNQIVRARVIWNTRAGVLVPTTAISRLAGKNFIFVATPYGRSDCASQAKEQTEGPKSAAPAADQLVAVQKPVTLGQIVGNNQEVLEGLNRNDRIVASGLLQLRSCAPIQDSSSQSGAQPRNEGV